MFTMEFKGYKAKIKRAAKLDPTQVHGLPSGVAVEVYPVDAFKEPLPTWITGAGNYVVPVENDWGLWFDWTENDKYNTAVVPTVKGMNPVTGKKTEGYGLEKYETKCPLHEIEFKDGLFCEECNYRWPHQNYVSSPNTLWWDGFRTTDGKVRQFFFTEDLAKSIPELVIGKSETVPAFGFAFYKTKNPRNIPVAPRQHGINFFPESFNRIDGPTGAGGIATSENIGWLTGSMDSVSLLNARAITWNKAKLSCNSVDVCEGSTEITGLFDYGAATSTFCSAGSSGAWRGQGPEGCVGVQGSQGPCGPLGADYLGMQGALAALNKVTCSAAFQASILEKRVEEKTSAPLMKTKDMSKLEPSKARPISAEVGVGAGAEIRQGLQPDLLGVGEWQEQPAAVMRIYFIFKDQFAEISAKGMKDLVGAKEGFLAGLPVG